MTGVFISYRRNDSDVAAGRLADDLSKIFGSFTIFRDVDTLEVGEDYTTALEHALDSCAALIAVIGPRWSTITDDAGRRRIEDPKDWVRMEIRRALVRGIRVIPLLISGKMPQEVEVPDDLKPLLKRQALELSDRHWKQGIELLAEALEKIPGITRRAPRPSKTAPTPSRRKFFIAAAILSAIAVAGWFGWEYRNAPAPIALADLSQWVRIRDSGTEGAVAGLSVVIAMEASLALQGRPVTLSARYLYEKAKRIDRFGPKTEGTDMSYALTIAETFGAPPEDRWPYIAGSKDLPKGVTWEDLDAAASNFRARTFRLSRYGDIPQQLAQGRAIVAVVDVTDGWTSVEAGKTGVVRLSDEEKLLGRHAIVIVAFNAADSSIKFVNSWGVSWGANGFGSMSEQSAQRAIKEMWAIDVPPLKS